MPLPKRFGVLNTNIQCFARKQHLRYPAIRTSLLLWQELLLSSPPAVLSCSAGARQECEHPLCVVDAEAEMCTRAPGYDALAKPSAQTSLLPCSCRSLSLDHGESLAD